MRFRSGWHRRVVLVGMVLASFLAPLVAGVQTAPAQGASRAPRARFASTRLLSRKRLSKVNPSLSRRRASFVMPDLALPRRGHSGPHASSASLLPTELGPNAARPLQPLAAATGPTLEALSAFPGTTFASDTVAVRPPDTQVAVGPVFVGEAVNSELTVWSRTGSLVTAFDLNDSFAVPPGFSFTDPRLVFDVLSGRWFLSGLAFDHALDSNVYVAVSDSSDPTAGWSAYQLTADIGVVSDQPKIGVSTDKVVISWNDFDPVETFL